MERLNPHTLVEISGIEKIHAGEEIPEWVFSVFEEAAYVIVRRGSQDGKIPIGIRGYERSQRFAGWINPEDILKTVTPSEALEQLDTVDTVRLEMPAFRMVKKVIPLLKEYEWGIGGSLQFELVTELPMVKQTSDIDIIMQRPATKIDINTAKNLLDKLKSIAGTHTDIQVVYGQNGFSLEEYAQQRSSKIMLKTMDGPQLVTDIWGD